MTGKKSKILLGVTGGIAAYKSAELVRLFIRDGHEVRAIMTASACEFITPLTMETLSGNEVSVEMFPKNRYYSTHHIALADWADLFIIAPATANFLGKAASGIADDLLSTTFPAVKCPVLIAPAMNSNMWDYPAVKKNVETLESFGFHFVGPDTGELACGWTGRGRMAEPRVIFEKALAVLYAKGRLGGKRVLVTASRTEEPIDAVRYISNRSSGKMGYAIAVEAMAEGADVTLVSGPSSLPVPGGIKFIRANTASDMAEAVKDNFDDCDILVMAAAVADYTPANPYQGKLKKSGDDMVINLKPTEDILKSIGERKKNQIVVGFALETDNAVENARKKLKEKNLDFIVVNNPHETGAGFDTDTNRADIISTDGEIAHLSLLTKRELAVEILSRAFPLLKES